jgi:hypothetical protein
MARQPSPIRDIRSLKTNLRETAASLDELDLKLRFLCAQASLCGYLESCGEPQRVVDLRSAARTLRMYAGFLEARIDGAQSQTEPSQLSVAEELVFQRVPRKRGSHGKFV